MKICVCGSPWSGKSTLTNKLSKKHNIDVYHLDELFIDDNWNKKTIEERTAIQKEILDSNTDRIIDWNYWDTMRDRIDVCDIIYILNIPRLVCIYRIIKRYIYNKLKLRSRIWIWEKKPVISRSFIIFVWNYHKTSWNIILKKLIKQNTLDKEVYIINRKDQIIN